MATDFDTYLSQHVGEYGRYQKVVTLLVLVVAGLYATVVISMVFTCYTPEYHCITVNSSLEAQRRPAAGTDNVTDGQVAAAAALPVTDTLQTNTSHWMPSKTSRTESCPTSGEGRNTSDDVTCVHWEYETSVRLSSIVTEFDLYCEKEVLAATAQSMFIIGSGVGVFISGFLADLFGRKPVFMLIQVALTVLLFISAFATHYILYAFCRFGIGMASMSQYTISFILATELVSPRWRSWIGTLLVLIWTVGFVMSSAIAYIARSRLHFEIVMAALNVPILAYYWLIPESPRWLYSRGRKEEGDAILRKMARYNGRPEPDYIDISTDKKEESVSSESMLDVLRSCTMLGRMTIQLLAWFSVSLVYFGLTWNVGNLAGDLYLNTFLSGILELPGYLLMLPAVNSPLGRRGSVALTMAAGGVVLLLTLAVPSGKSIMATALSMIGKALIGLAFAAIYIFTAELYPTPVRTAGVSISSAAARLGSLTAPFIAQVGRESQTLVATLFGVTSLMAASLLLLLPETRNRPLPQTVEECVQLRNTLCQRPCHSQTSNYSPTTQTDENVGRTSSDPL